ncbi:SAV_6107 family HEPN domain-containing protein [Pseudactinotalea suaedae]|uniref:SAV_6107 family HEPN domain-containing protein n=1 Tax=Pseudactinotalea suaedae TaxID=1524924 RepID=UPI0012E1D3E4|nr:SAV_6107 family HEPN domain-containing protein [Pseudactinotalea suaedae]
MASTTLRASGANPVAQQLIRRARLELDAADASTDPAMRFLHAHMAAIRGASAVLALGAVVPRRRGRLRSVWEQLADAGQEWGAWAARFEAGAQIRAAIDADRIGDLDATVADDAVWAADEFVAQVAAAARAAGLASSVRAGAIAS